MKFKLKRMFESKNELDQFVDIIKTNINPKSELVFFVEDLPGQMELLYPEDMDDFIGMAMSVKVPIGDTFVTFMPMHLYESYRQDMINKVQNNIDSLSFWIQTPFGPMTATIEGSEYVKIINALQEKMRC